MLAHFSSGRPVFFALVAFVLFGCSGANEKRLKELEAENASLKQELAKYQTVALDGEEYLELPQFGKPASEKLVYYRTPFASPPNLTFPHGRAYGYKVTEQKADCFKLERAILEKDKPLPPLPKEGGVQVGRAPPHFEYGKDKFKWKAEGRPAK